MHATILVAMAALIGVLAQNAAAEPTPTAGGDRLLEKLERVEREQPAPTPPHESRLPGARPLDMPDPAGSQDLPLPPLPLPPR